MTPIVNLDVLGDGPIGVAVSGGGDSTALLCLLSDWAKTADRILHVASVNHHLRDEAEAEVAQVAQLCAALSWTHTALDWTDWAGVGNLQQAAREARYDLLGRWAKKLGIRTIATGHTMEDQAETVLMRMARGSGVDGLSGMSSVEIRDGISWGRPILNLKREGLRDYLRARNVPWSDDQSNQDARFDRVKIRQSMEVLNDLGLTVDRLARTAESMQTARTALETMTFDLAKTTATPTLAGNVLIKVKDFASSPVEIQNRLIAHALCWVSGAVYRPRLNSLTQAIIAVTDGQKRTLHGCVLSFKNGTIEIAREVSAVRDGTRFDGRWDVTSGDVRPLNAVGLQQVPNWREAGFSRTALLATPAIWEGETVIGAPVLGYGVGQATLIGGLHGFFNAILSH